MSSNGAHELISFLESSGRTWVLTGAGCSQASGIAVYRDHSGQWMHRRPVSYQRFRSDESTRRRYWAGSFVGWRRMARARRNGAHQALAWMEDQGWIEGIVTQNVDGLHRAAGSRQIVALHGRLDRVVCLHCGARFARSAVQEELEKLNPEFEESAFEARPDGDVEILESVRDEFRYPHCPGCGGQIKPDVVFFGESVPRARVEKVTHAITSSDLLLVVGSSLTVWSGYRFVRLARQLGIPVVAVNLGQTRADDLFTSKIEAACESVLPHTVECLRQVEALPSSQPAEILE